MREKRGFGPWGWLLLIFGLLVFFSNGGFFADGTNIISPAVAERLNVDQSIILTMNSVAGIVGVLIAVVAFVLGCSALLDRFARYHFKRVSLGLYLLLQIPLVMCCGVLYLLKFPTFYSLPIALGLAFSVWGLYFWMKGALRRDREVVSCGIAVHGAGRGMPPAAAGAVVGGVSVVLARVHHQAPAAHPAWRTRVRLPHRALPRGGGRLMAYNHARFGSFTDFGANYNLTVNDMTKRGVEHRAFGPGAVRLLPATAQRNGRVPVFAAGAVRYHVHGQTIKEVTFGGIFACLPVLWVLPFAKRVLQLRMSQRSTRTIAGVIVVLLLGGVIVALADAEMAGILQRYFADFSFMFLAAVVLLVFIVNENLQPGSTVQNLLMKVLLVLVAVSVLYSALLCFVPETGWYSDVYPWAYRDIIETAQFWT